MGVFVLVFVFVFVFVLVFVFVFVLVLVFVFVFVSLCAHLTVRVPTCLGACAPRPFLTDRHTRSPNSST